MATRVLGPTGSRRRRRFLFVSLLLVACAALFLAGAARAVHDEAFQLDGDAIASTVTNVCGPGETPPPPCHTQLFDWDSFFNAAGAKSPVLPDASRPGFTASGFDRDFNTTNNGTVYDTSDATTYTQGSKDTLNISSNWVCTSANNVTNKGDIQNAYAVSYTDPSTGHKFLYFAQERNSNAGSANVGFWFLQDSADCPQGGGAWTGNHRDGDLFIVSAFTNGGTVSNITAYRWTGGANGGIDPTPVAGGGDCRAAGQTAGDPICATANTANITVPWLTNNNGKTNGLGHTLLTSEFFEGGIDLTQAHLANRCFNVFVGDTRSSPSLTATLYDFARGSLGQCTSTTVTTPNLPASSEIPASASVTASDSATVTVNGISQFSGTVDFYLCGPGVAAGANCNTGGVHISQQTLTDVTSPQTVGSGNVTVTKVGKYCWRAVFSGDSASGVPGSSDPSAGPPPDTTSQSECFTLTPKQSTLATAAGAGPVDFGQPVTDTATLGNTANEPGTGGLGDGSINPTGGNGPAQGSITFTLYKANCSTLATGTGTNPQSVPVSGDGTYGPVSFTPDAPGTYHWVASYSGDLPNTLSSTHNTACNDTGEDVVVRQIPTSVATRQSWYPNDEATITSSVAGNNLGTGGTVVFKLWSDGSCGSTLGSTVLYKETISNVGGANAVTVNTHNPGGGDAGTVTYSETTAYADGAGSTKGPRSWQVVYSPAASDTAHLGSSSSCSTAAHTEKHTYTYQNDAG